MSHEQAKAVIEKVGGIALVADVTGKDFATVYRWTVEAPRGTGFIPDDSKRKIMEFARRKRIALKWDDFFPPITKKEKGHAFGAK